MEFQSGVPLAPLTTLRLGGPAKRFARLTEENELVDALRSTQKLREPLFILGGGSNIVIADQGFDGLVLQMGLRGIQAQKDEGRVLVDVGAGEDWQNFVDHCIHENWSGPECLAGIPGQVGASPVQNIGAYGHEVSELIASVRVFDRQKYRFIEIPTKDCDFSYRHSKFKGIHRYVVTRVRFVFTPSQESAPVLYGELSRKLGILPGQTAALQDVRKAVLELRRSKGMMVDPNDPDTVSAGSFMVNPIVTTEELNALEIRAGEKPPRFAEGNNHWKVPAAWLIERAGFNKGFIQGNVGISTKHCLALIHRGNGTAQELLSLAKTIQDGVYQRFGIRLSLEPVLVGFESKE